MNHDKASTLFCCLLALLFSAGLARPAVAGSPSSIPSQADKHIGDTDTYRYWEYMVLPERDIIFLPEEVLALSQVKHSKVVADIGAGAGYFTFRFARAVGPGGKVYAVDIDLPEDLRAYMNARICDPTITPHANVELIQNRFDSVDLPAESIDLGFICLGAILVINPEVVTTPWEKKIFAQQQKMVASVYRAVKPGGRLVVIDLLATPGEAVAYPASFGDAAPFTTAIGRDAVIRNYEGAGFRMVKDFDIFRNERHARNVARLKTLPVYRQFGEEQRFVFGSKMCFLVFEKPGTGVHP